MTRKLPNGNYLVPQLLDKVVREYAPDGKIVWEAKTPEEPKEAWPFTAIRLPNGNLTFVCCAVEGVNHVRLVDKLIGDYQDIRHDADQAFEKEQAGEGGAQLRLIP